MLAHIFFSWLYWFEQLKNGSVCLAQGWTSNRRIHLSRGAGAWLQPTEACVGSDAVGGQPLTLSCLQETVPFLHYYSTSAHGIQSTIYVDIVLQCRATRWWVLFIKGIGLSPVTIGQYKFYWLWQDEGTSAADDDGDDLLEILTKSLMDKRSVMWFLWKIY